MPYPYRWLTPALAGLPPQVGIYGYMLGGIGYALLGSSRQLAVSEKTDSGQWLRSLDCVLGDDGPASRLHDR